jgi:hypothetical protein
MFLIFKILLVALCHVILFACYPETGPNGKIYLVVSTLAWAGFVIVLNSGLKFFKLISGLIGLIFNLAFFALMVAAIALTMPQRDKTSVLEKAQKRQFPDVKSAKAGLLKLGEYYEDAKDTDVKSELEKAGDKIKK